MHILRTSFEFGEQTKDTQPKMFHRQNYHRKLEGNKQTTLYANGDELFFFSFGVNYLNRQPHLSDGTSLDTVPPSTHVFEDVKFQNTTKSMGDF